MKRKLLITIGAGASIDFDLPSVAKIDAILDACAMKISPLASNPSSNLYRYCRDTIEAYYAGAPKPAMRNWTNFEEILYQLNLLALYLGDPSRMRGSNALLRPNPIPDVLEFGRSRKTVDSDVLRTLTSILVDEIVDHFIDSCAVVTTNKRSELAELASFLTTLRTEFDIGIITLNYDNVFTQAFPSLFTGFDTTGKFQPLSVFTRSQWGFIYHLHGSVHFAMSGTSHDLHGITWAPTPTKGHAVHAFGRNAQSSMEGTAYPISPIVAGYGKAQQILRQPFRTYFAQVNRLVHEADSLMFIGYGFSDLHLNAAFSEVRDRRRPTLVVDWANNNQDPLQFRRDSWTYNLFGTLAANPADMSEPGHIAAPMVSDLKARNQVECSRNPNYPLAVWYNGFLEACRNVQSLLPYLR
jgi:hypothetical protein